ncbi:MAG: hypothetical protein GXO80_07795 [Chlorobi bacterium]|nr:hypothetical protein [Chlorobiota bacterium]
MKKLIHILFLSCLKATELIEKKLHVQLSFKEKLQLKLHKSMCSACRLYDKQSYIIHKKLSDHYIQNSPINSEELKKMIKKKLAEH